MAAAIWCRWLKRLEGKEVAVDVKVTQNTSGYNKKEVDEFEGTVVLVEDDSFVLKDRKGDDTYVILMTEVVGLRSKIENFPIKSDVKIRQVPGKKLVA